jgi:hypothetical protein
MSEDIKHYYTHEICDVCKGEGTTRKSEMTDYHRREYDTWTILCPKCEGSGILDVYTVVRKQAHIHTPPRARGT